MVIGFCFGCVKMNESRLNDIPVNSLHTSHVRSVGAYHSIFKIVVEVGQTLMKGTTVLWMSLECLVIMAQD
jgi:hypothetical protein